MPLTKSGGLWHDAAVNSDVIIIGAGVAGLSCARVLAKAGKSVRIVERSRGVGGRCATRRIAGQAIDHGLVFLHGQSAEFLTALREVPGDWCEPWPAVVRGTGTPCQPNAFARGARCLAPRAGVSAFPKHLAHELDVTLETDIKGLALDVDRLSIEGEQAGEPVKFAARDVVLALAGPEAQVLLDCPAIAQQTKTLRALLRMMPSVACATVIALYPPEIGVLDWDIWYPEHSEALQLVANDSSKRDSAPQVALVLQARPAWSSSVLGTAETEWGPQLLADAARVIAPWVAQPTEWQAHLWHHARVTPECELSSPLLLELGQGRRVGIVGELFAPGGGVQAAWRSGQMLAQRLLTEVQP